MGAGKTLSAILASRTLKTHTLIFCPNSVIDTWKQSIQDAFPDSDVASKTFTPKWNKGNKYRYLILNYEMLQQPNSEVKIKQLCQDYNLQLLVIDEVQMAKQRTKVMSLRRQRLLSCRKFLLEENPDLYILGMSGTPVINNIKEGKALLELLSGKSYDDVGEKATLTNCALLFRHLLLNGLRWRPDFAIEQNIKEIDIDCPNLAEELKEYFNPKNYDILKLEKLLTKYRLPTIIDNLSKHTIIYTHFVGDGIIEMIRNAVQGAGWSVGIYDGKDKSGLAKFKNKDIDILIASSTVGTGVDGLQLISNNLIFNTTPYTSAEFDQIVARILRQGQKEKSINIIFPKTRLDCNGKFWSWCQSKLNRIKFKRSLADCAVDGVLPEGRLRSDKEFFRDRMDLLQRLQSDGIKELDRKDLTIEESINSSITVPKKPQYSLHTETHLKWNSEKSSTTHKRLIEGPQEWYDYHKSWNEDKKEWRSIPIEVLGKYLKQELSLKNLGYILVDAGCGEAYLSNTLKNITVKSFDHVAINEDIVSCDMTALPLKDNSVHQLVSCLSLNHGRNQEQEYLKEFRRVLKNKSGKLRVVLPSSKIDDQFIPMVEKIGFVWLDPDDELDGFRYLTFIKK